MTQDALGKGKSERQEQLWVPVGDVSRGPGSPFCTKLNRMLA